MLLRNLVLGILVFAPGCGSKETGNTHSASDPNKLTIGSQTAKLPFSPTGDVGEFSTTPDRCLTKNEWDRVSGEIEASFSRAGSLLKTPAFWISDTTKQSDLFITDVRSFCEARGSVSFEIQVGKGYLAADKLSEEQKKNPPQNGAKVRVTLEWIPVNVSFNVNSNTTSSNLVVDIKDKDVQLPRYIAPESEPKLVTLFKMSFSGDAKITINDFLANLAFSKVPGGVHVASAIDKMLGDFDFSAELNAKYTSWNVADTNLDYYRQGDNLIYVGNKIKWFSRVLCGSRDDRMKLGMV